MGRVPVGLLEGSFGSGLGSTQGIADRPPSAARGRGGLQGSTNEGSFTSLSPRRQWLHNNSQQRQLRTSTLWWRLAQGPGAKAHSYPLLGHPTVPPSKNQLTKASASTLQLPPGPPQSPPPVTLPMQANHQAHRAARPKSEPGAHSTRSPTHSRSPKRARGIMVQSSQMPTEMQTH